MSKYIVSGDIHLNAWNNFSTILSNGINSRLWHTHNRIKDMIDIGKKNNIDAMLLCGDIFHVKKLEIEVLDVSARAFDKVLFPIFGIAGNHDQMSSLQEIYSCRALSGVIDYLDTYNGNSRILKNDKIYGIPFVNTRDKLVKAFKSIPKQNTILMLHAGVVGAVMAEGFMADAEDCYIPSDVKGLSDIVISSHFHTPQIINIEKEEFYKVTGPLKYTYEPYNTILLPGAPEQHSFGDVGQDRGCWIVDTTEHTLEFIPLSSPKFVIADDNTPPEMLKGNYVKWISKENNPNLALAEDVVHEVPIEVKTVASHLYHLNMSDPINKILSEYVNNNPQKGLDNTRMMAEGKRLCS